MVIMNEMNIRLKYSLDFEWVSKQRNRAQGLES